MDLVKYREKLQEEVIQPMLEYRRELGKECGYGAFHVLRCKTILCNYLKRLNRIKVTDENIMSQVRRVVLRLNKLNNTTDGCLIETDGRESIWEIIQTAAIDCGLNVEDEEEDITMEWREW